MKNFSVVVCVAVGCFLAVPAAAQDKGWIDVNFGTARAAEDGYSTSVSLRQFSETATFSSDYAFPRGASFDFGGGFMFTPVLGVGVNLQGTSSQAPPALSIRIPHPNFFNTFATDTTLGDTQLTRAEGSINLQAMVVATPHSKRLRVRFFGGPAYFRVTQDTVDDIGYSQNFQVFGRGNVVDITTFEASEAVGTGWGFHGGGDVAYFFNRIIGVGGFARFSRGNVELADFSGAYQVKAGGFQSGGGLRLRF